MRRTLALLVVLLAAACPAPTRRPEPILELPAEATITDDLSHPTDVVDRKKLRVEAASDLVLTLTVDAGDGFAGELEVFQADPEAAVGGALVPGAQELGPYRVGPGWVHLRIRARRWRAVYTLRASLRPLTP